MNKIIPPSDREHRDGFNNEVYIDELTIEKKRQVEDKLIQMLSNREGIDNLVVETLDYMKSEKSLSVLYQKLGDNLSDMDNLIIASSTFKINQDPEMINSAISSFKKMDRFEDPYYTYKLISGFYYLSKFSSPATNDVIKAYLDHSDYLVSYNAKRHYNPGLS